MRALHLFDTAVGDIPVTVSDPTPAGQPLAVLSANAGGSNAQMLGEGNINRQTANPGINPASTGADVVLAVFNLPANFFDVAGRGINIIAQGSVANNVNTKTLKLIVGATAPVVGQTVSGGTTIASLVTNTSAGSGGWQLEANVFKYGAAGSNTQLALHAAGQAGNVVATLVAPSALTQTESAVIPICVTGNAATTATDITQNFLEINAMN